ncbi:MAG: NAD-dependent epimerase/dehydratase family protein, partial [Verrucomicrobiota bacterium]
MTDHSLVVLGAGYVGGELARRAAAAGMRVTALTRNPARAAQLAACGVHTVIADLATLDWHDRVPADADLVLNSVASGGGGLPGYQHSYVEGLRSILAWSRRTARPGHLIYTGSTSVYPQGDGARLDESAPTIAPGLDEPAAVLRTAEQRALDWPGRATVLRLAGIYGPGRHHLLDQLRTTPPPATLPGAGGHHLNLIHRDDICGGCWAAWAADNTTAGTFNLADDGAATRAEVVA